MEMSEEEVEARLAEEREHCEHLNEIGRLATERGLDVGEELELPELNPDGSYANDEDNSDDEEARG